MAKGILIDHVFKVFGDEPEQALELVRQGLSKKEILARTGQSIGVFDATFEIQAGKSSSSWASRARASRRWCGC